MPLGGVKVGAEEAALVRIAERLAPHLPIPAPWTPSEDQVREAEAVLGALPREYKLFTRRFGAVDWPLRILDAVDLAAQPPEPGWICFARAGDHRFGFDPAGLVVREGDEPEPGVSFFSWLEQRITSRETAAPKGHPKSIIRRRKRG